MQDPQSLTLEDLEDFIDTPDSLNERYTFTVQGGGANEEETGAETAARDDTEPTQAIDAPVVEPEVEPVDEGNMDPNLDLDPDMGDEDEIPIEPTTNAPVVEPAVETEAPEAVVEPGDDNGDNNSESNNEPDLGSVDSNLNSDINIDIGSVGEEVNQNEVVEEVEEEIDEAGDEAAENRVALEEPEMEREAGEFIIDTNDFEFLDSDKPVFIREEIQLPDYKVVTTEEEQIADLTNELMKSVPEEKREDKRVLRNIRKQVEAFIVLKNKHSTFENSEISGSKLLTNEHREVMEKIMSGDMSNKMYRPVVNQTKVIYQNETTDSEGATLKSFPLDTRENTLVSNTGIITNQSSLRRRYKNDTRLRHNYSYFSEMAELNGTFNDYTNTDDNGFKVNLTESTEVYTSAFPENDLAAISRDFPEARPLDKHVESGDINFDLIGNPFAKNNNINITGFVKLPDDNVKLSSFIEKPLRNSVGENYLDFSLREKLLSSEPQVINLNREVGARVKLCIPNPEDKSKNIDVSGTITNINQEDYTIEISNPPSGINRVIRMNKRDKTVVVKRSDLMNDDGSLRECYHTGAAIFKFPQEVLNTETMKQLLEEVVPKSSDVLRQHFKDIQMCENLSQVNSVIEKYDIHTDKLTSDLITPIRAVMETRNSATLDKSRAARAKLQDILKTEPAVKRQMVELLNRKLLEEFREYYGEYPHYNSEIDSTVERLRWLYSQYDQGTLLFKTIVLKRFGSFYRTIATSREKLQSELDKLRSKQFNLEDKLDKILIDAARGESECPERKLVKVYHSIADLEADHLREIEIDTDKRPLINPSETRGVMRDGYTEEGMESRSMYLVKSGDYCLLDDENGKSVFKRAPVQGGDMWIRETDVNVDALVQSNSDFCNQFTMNLDELTKQLSSRRSGCFFNTQRGTCLPSEVENIDREMSDINTKIADRTRMMTLVHDSATYNDYIEKLVSNLRKSLSLYRKLQENKFKSAAKKYEKIAEAEPDEYTDFYKKVDKYLESINSLPGEERSKMLIPFLDKYARDADTSEGENPKNLYSKIGNRVLMCKHHKILIDFYTNSENSENTFKYLKVKWCAESEGKLYCTNCGQEVFDADYETVEGFAANGAHIVSTEVMELDEEAENALQEVKYIEKLLEKEASQEDTKLIHSVCKTLTDLMGIRLRDSDRDSTLRKTIEVNNVNIKPKDAWLAGQKKVPKSQAVIDKAFNNYRTRNIVINTAGVLFIFLQANVFGYSIKNPHSKCKASLRGYPLDSDETSDTGITYISCLLETLRDSGSDIYISLKKANVPEGIKRVISYCLRDTFIRDILDTRRTSIDDDVKSGRNVNRDWNEFKPPMMKYDVAYDSTEVMKPENPLFDEHTNLLGMKVIQNINGVINSGRIENRMFDPVPLGNTCCSEPLDANYDYRNYFIQSGDVIPLVDTLIEMNQYEPGKDVASRIIMDRVVMREAPEKFDKEVSPDADDETTRKSVFVNNITEGPYIGKPHIYDEYNICVLTGISRETLLTRDVSIDEYNEYTQALSKSRLFSQLSNNRVYNIISVLNEMRISNGVLKSNEFFGEIIERLSGFKSGDATEVLDATWTDLQSQVSIERDALVGLMSRVINKGKIDKLVENLEKLGELRNIRSDMETSMSSDEALKIFNEKREKLLANYFHKLRVLVNNIHNRNQVETDTVRMLIPKHWEKSASEDTLNKLINSNVKSHKTVHKNIEIVNSNPQLSNLVKSLSQFVDKNTSGVKNILGKTSIVNCNESVKLVSVVSTENSGDILYYMLILTFIEMMNTVETSTELAGLMGGAKPRPVFEDLMDAPDTEEKAPSNEPEPLDDEEDFTASTGPEPAPEGGRDTDGAVRDARKFTAELIFDFISDLTREQDLLDKYTNTYIQKSINKVSEEQKEENLKFMEQLETEARQSLKAMLTIGVDSWKNLASKNKELYFEVPEDQREVDEPVGEDIETDHRSAAARDLGEDYTEEEFSRWQELTARSEQIEREALREHVMPGDDGDALDYNSDNDYIND